MDASPQESLRRAADLDCARRYRPELGPGNRPSLFDIDLAALIAERGRECLVVGMPPVPCPRCGSRRTELRILPPKTGDGGPGNE
jgi:hypothetical protein